MHWLWLYLTVAAVATVLTFVMTPLCRFFAWKYNILDKPLGEHHKQHENATPLLGGMAMLLGWLVTLLGGLVLAKTEALGAVFPEAQKAAAGISDISSLLFSIIGGALALAVMGVIDDRKPFGPFPKLFFQFLICGLVAYYPKIQISLFTTNPYLMWGMTVLWFLFIINAFNFFDNMDGLAAGIACIAAVSFAFVAGYRGQYFVATLGAATAGVSFGFYFFNRFPASIFMGDSGSHFLGYLLAVMGSLTLFYHPDSTPTAAPVFIPLFILALPIFDAFAVIIIRRHLGTPIFHGDHNHMSHRFLKMGLEPKVAVLMVHLISMTISLAALQLLWAGIKGVILVFLQTACVLVFVSMLHMRYHDVKQEVEDDETAE
jgi:UDP-GlcNAc:undecaprenyl-phosphate/decaprenyl-phosphate GlcNAc-1-phosphate transferase